MIEDIRNPNDEIYLFEKRLKGLENIVKSLSDKLNEVISVVNHIEERIKDIENE